MATKNKPLSMRFLVSLASALVLAFISSLLLYSGLQELKKPTLATAPKETNAIEEIVKEEVVPLVSVPYIEGDRSKETGVREEVIDISGQGSGIRGQIEEPPVPVQPVRPTPKPVVIPPPATQVVEPPKPVEVAKPTELAPPEPVVELATALSTPKLLSPRGAINMTGQKNITFSWQMDERATNGRLMIYLLDPTASGGRRTLLTQPLGKTTTYNFTRMNQLKTGNYVWTLENNGLVEGVNLKSSLAEGSFSLSLDLLGSVTVTSPTQFSLATSPTQRIEWLALQGASRYRVLINVDDEQKTKISDTTTASLFITSRLIERNYGVTITALNDFNELATEQTTIKITVNP